MRGSRAPVNARCQERLVAPGSAKSQEGPLGGVPGQRTLAGGHAGVSGFAPRFTITNAITAGLTAIERARGFLEAATLSDEWVRKMSQRALLVEAHATTHIEGTELTLEEAERAWMG